MEVLVEEVEVEVVVHSDSPLARMSARVTGTAPLAIVQRITLPAAPAASSVVRPRMNRPVVVVAAMRVEGLDLGAVEVALVAPDGNLEIGFAQGYFINHITLLIISLI